MSNKELTRKWVNALRSGKYGQITGQLGRENTETKTCSYCCLGVLTEVAIEDGLKLNRWTDNDGEVYYGDEGMMPPDEVRERIDLASWEVEVLASDLFYHPEDEGYEPDEMVQVELVELNDTHFWNFNKIADAIESTYLVGNSA